MTEAYAADYLDDIAFELLVISKCSPLMDTTQAASGTYNVETNGLLVGIVGTSTVGMTLPEAVDKLGIRPLAFGAAWKCLDILMEHALSAGGYSTRNKNGRWSITEKVKHARAQHGQAEPLTSTPDIWTRLTAAYVATEQVRHSLVHRNTKTHSNGDLVGVDDAGGQLRPVTAAEQEAMLRVAQRVAEAIRGGAMSARDKTALMAELDTLSGVTGLPNTGAIVVRHPPVVVDVPIAIGDRVDLVALKTRLRGTYQSAGEIDVRFIVGDDTYTAYLENIPDDAITFDPTALSWFEPRSS